jgi:stage II sporulation protein AB (anti-sigma F factor)
MLHSVFNKDKNELKLDFSPDPANIKLVREQVCGYCEEAGIASDHTHDVCSIVIEAVTNAIKHAKCRSFSVTIKLDGGCMTAEVADDGIGFVFTAAHCEFPDIDSLNGRGFPIMRSFTDELSVSSKIGHGTTITMIRDIKKTSIRDRR